MKGNDKTNKQQITELEQLRQRVTELERSNSELKRAEETFRESKEDLESLFNDVKDGIVLLDMTGKIIRINKRITETTGFAEKDIVGKRFKFLKMFTADSLIKMITSFAKTVAGHPPPPYEVEGYIKSGEKRIGEIHSSQLKKGGKTVGAVAVIRDITKRKQVEEKLRKSLADLERSNKELEQFANVASHDLQEPLRMVSSYTQLLERRYKDKLGADAQEFIAYVVDGANRMQRLIQDLLTYSRLGSRQKTLEPTDCNVILGRVRANLKVAIEENKALVTNYELPIVMADATQLVQVFQNLIGNAINFRSEEPPRIHVSAKKKSNEWIFSVQDNGRGIAPEYHERIFVIFQRLEGWDEHSGTGIGLSICRSIVERHGGRIWVESKPGKGATFYFTIPTSGGKHS